MKFDSLIQSAGWDITYSYESAQTPGRTTSLMDLGLSHKTLGITKEFNGKVFEHQKAALQAFLAGRDVCLSTSTGSGKSLAFYLAGIETITRDPKAKVLAVYPLLALSNEQETRWSNAAALAGASVKVGRIDGKVAIPDRNSIIKDSNIIVMTPDVLHAWLLSNLSTAPVKRFVKHLRLVVLDEAHTYTGVFGSNSAFLFMRLLHANKQLGGTLQFFAASATIRSPEEHLKRLTTRNFTVIGAERESAPKHHRQLLMVQPKAFKGLIDEVGQLIQLVGSHGGKFICFADSRKQVEYTSAAADRASNRDHHDESEDGSDQPSLVEDSDEMDLEPLCKKGVLPYRSGYESKDRQAIEKALRDGTIRGVISTSALEMGIDIPDLSVAILVGVPQSATSLQQRMGRVGRNGPGTVVIINNGSAHSAALFKKPERIHNLPLAESSLYLENRNIQYIHALCLARRGGEHDQVRSSLHEDDDTKIETKIDMPSAFLELCRMERTGDIPADLRELKGAAGDRPNTTYPLRSIETSYQITFRRHGVERPLGTITMPQALREAYPGAIYYHKAKPWRVYKVDSRSKIIHVRPEKRYFTKPLCVPTEVYPMIQQGTLYSALRWGDLTIFESSMQVSQRVNGFEETQGSRKKQVQYPLSGIDGIYCDSSSFVRNFYTTGVGIAFSQFQREQVKMDILSRALFEGFLMTVPLERHDIDVAHYRLKQECLELKKEERFISMFDQHFGSLRLTQKLTDPGVIGRVIQQAVELLETNPDFETTPDTVAVAKEMLYSLDSQPERLANSQEFILSITEQHLFEQIIMPGSVGLSSDTEFKELCVDHVFFHHKYQQLLYQCHPLNQPAGKRNSVQIPLAKLVPIDGRSVIGFYNLDTGEVLEELPSVEQALP